MFGNDPKKIQSMMKKLNMNTKEIDATEVVIKTDSKQIIISNPQVMVVNMMGKEVFQIVGDISEKSGINEEDVKMVMDKTGKDRDTVVQKLEELDNDLARAIIELKEEES